MCCRLPDPLSSNQVRYEVVRPRYEGSPLKAAGEALLMPADGAWADFGWTKFCLTVWCNSAGSLRIANPGTKLGEGANFRRALVINLFDQNSQEVDCVCFHVAFADLDRPPSE